MDTRVMRRLATTKTGGRSGVITGWSIAGIIAACLCTGFAINYLHITLVRNDALRCAEASALAAGHQLVSDEVLRLNQHAFEFDGRISAGRERALKTAAEYQATSLCPPLAPHQILFEVPFTKGQGVRLSAQEQAVPARVVVSWSRSENVSRIPLFMTGFFGRQDAVVDVEAVAAIENCPVALVPLESAAIPGLPFAIPDLPQDQSGNSWHSMIECGRGKDEYSWNPERRIVERGPDGLPELTLTVSLDNFSLDCGSLVPVRLSAGRDDGDELCRLTRYGISRKDLSSVQLSELQFPQDVQHPNLEKINSRQTPRKVQETLSSRIGQPLICFLTKASAATSATADTADTEADTSESADSQNMDQSPSFALERPVGIRILHVSQSTPEQVQVVLQPCVIVTSTARMDDAEFASRNRYIYAVRLVR